MCQGWDAVESKTEAMDAFVNVGSDMAEFVRLQQNWHVNDDTVRVTVVVLLVVVVVVVVVVVLVVKLLC